MKFEKGEKGQFLNDNWQKKKLALKEVFQSREFKLTVVDDKKNSLVSKKGCVCR